MRGLRLGSALGVVVVFGCGGSGSGGGGGSAGTAGSVGSGGGGGAGGTAQGGAAGSAGSTGGTQSIPGDTFVVTRLLLGDTDGGLTPDPNAWKKLGVDLDGIQSTPTDGTHCTAQLGGSKASIQTDGDKGIDNSWGANVVPILSALKAGLSASVADGLSEGDGTLLINTPSFGNYTNVAGFVTSLYVAAPTTGALAKSQRLATSECLVNGDLAQPLTTFPSSALKNSILQTSTPTTLTLPLDPKRVGFASLRIHQARISAWIHGSTVTPQADSGIIAGVIDTEELVSAFAQIAGSLDPTLCDSTVLESIAQQIRAASDIMKDGTNGDPSKTCDGISVGIGFSSVWVKLTGVAAPVPAAPDPCAK